MRNELTQRDLTAARAGSGIPQNLGLGRGLGKKANFRIEMVEVRECGNE